MTLAGPGGPEVTSTLFLHEVHAQEGPPARQRLVVQCWNLVAREMFLQTHGPVPCGPHAKSITAWRRLAES
jgi:hypothetical protein